jgi:hypothetical protein
MHCNGERSANRWRLRADNARAAKAEISQHTAEHVAVGRFAYDRDRDLYPQVSTSLSYQALVSRSLVRPSPAGLGAATGRALALCEAASRIISVPADSVLEPSRELQQRTAIEWLRGSFQGAHQILALLPRPLAIPSQA